MTVMASAKVTGKPVQVSREVCEVIRQVLADMKADGRTAFHLSIRRGLRFTTTSACVSDPGKLTRWSAEAVLEDVLAEVANRLFDNTYGEGPAALVVMVDEKVL